MKNWFGQTKEICATCTQRVYQNERTAYDSKIFHAECFRCKKCNVRITPSTVGKFGGEYYCNQHMMDEYKLHNSSMQNMKLSLAPRQLSKGPSPMNSPNSHTIPTLHEPKCSDNEILPDWLIPEKLESGFRYIIEKDFNGKVSFLKKSLDVLTDESGGSRSVSKPSSPTDDVPVKKKKFGFTILGGQKKKSLPVNTFDEKKRISQPYSSPPSSAESEERKRRLSQPLSVQTDESLLSSSPGGKVYKKLIGNRTSMTPRIKRNFGVEWDFLMEKETTPCPRIVIDLVVNLMNNKAWRIEGIFRISGVQTDIETLVLGIENGEVYDFDEVKDIHAIASILKLFFRSLPSPFFPLETYPFFLLIPMMGTDEEKVVEIARLMEHIGPSKKHCFGLLMKLFEEVIQNSKENMMDSRNLATVFGINLLYEETEDPNEYISMQQKVTTAMTEVFDLYPKFKDIWSQN